MICTHHVKQTWRRAQKLGKAGAQRDWQGSAEDWMARSCSDRRCESCTICWFKNTMSAGSTVACLSALVLWLSVMFLHSHLPSRLHSKNCFDPGSERGPESGPTITPLGQRFNPRPPHALCRIQSVVNAVCHVPSLPNGKRAFHPPRCRSMPAITPASCPRRRNLRSYSSVQT